ncbi:hypothetical protein PHMEG_00023282 [Phytophthora megakarya]|uniref:Uncharacterized protein n=1 Tax=Phytophthora megakarya TaxID=4795 RepID=A0A225VHG1_9STRA|nr:hypothetical protein PHMEG_00023282 [Phytophthora megakarya]
MRKERVDRGGRPFPYTRSKTRWRKRPSDEIKYLNEQVVELEKVKTQLSMINATPDALVGDQPKALKKLREKSSNEKLDAALAENRKLHAMVTARFQVTKALQAAIDEDVRQRAKAVVNEFDFALLGEEREYQHPALSKILV